MIPSNQITPTPILSAFEGPLAGKYYPLTQTVMGGIALNDPSRGRLYQQWIVDYNVASSEISIKPVYGSVVFTLTVPGVKTVSLAFDNNMAPAICWQTSTGSTLYYYSTLTASYETIVKPGTTSCRVCVDDPREFNNANSDVIFAYTLSGNLYWTQQRDRYLTQRLVGATSGKLIKMGRNVGSRLQFGLA